MTPFPLDALTEAFEERAAIMEYDGGHARWLNTGDAPGGLYRMHCAMCSPPPGAEAPQVVDASAPGEE